MNWVRARFWLSYLFTRTCISFKEFHHVERGSIEHFVDFIEFEKLCNKLVKHDMSLLESVKAYFLSSAANENENKNET